MNPFSENKTPHKEFRQKGDFGMPLVLGLLVLALSLGFFVFYHYVSSEKIISLSLSEIQKTASQLSLEECATNNIQWYQNCHAMTQMCDEAVSRRMKICVLHGDLKQKQCAAYKNEVYGYNFGYEQCKPYFKNRALKKVCADSYQTIADFCKSVQAAKNGKL